MLFLLISNRYSSPSSNQRNLKKSSFRIQFQSLRFLFFKTCAFLPCRRERKGCRWHGRWSVFIWNWFFFGSYVGDFCNLSTDLKKKTKQNRSGIFKNVTQFHLLQLLFTTSVLQSLFTIINISLSMTFEWILQWHGKTCEFRYMPDIF
jgi:hypothetical protein